MLFSTTLGSLIDAPPLINLAYQSLCGPGHSDCTKSSFNYGAFVLNQIKRHIESQALKLPICYPKLNYGILLSQKIDILLPSEIMSPASSLFNVHPCLLKSYHVPDIKITSSMSHLDAPSRELMTSSFGSRILQLLSSEAKDIDQLIQRPMARKAEVDAVLRVMKVVLSNFVANSSSQRLA